jgi:N-acetylmuramic acid 6-phosphate etherase
LMVNVRADNLKLKARAAGIVSRIAGVSEKDAAASLDLARGEVKPAVLICAGAKSPDAARQLLLESKGNLRLALSRLAAAR